jgi:transcriptional regulator with XRE-family HTH domain
MDQPELGKKIAELRKAKGFTQEELVEKCNLNIRTLQRIESCEVTPRLYTLKTIFSALEYDTNGLFEISKTGFSIQIWLEQFYRYVLDLFNLKTNKMKKITILTIIFSTIVFGLFALCTESKAQKEKKAVAHVIDSDSSPQKTSNEMIFSNFYCEDCFDDNDDIIGHNIKFSCNGVNMNIGLIKLNRKTREFNAGFIKGKLLQNKVELTCPKDLRNDSSVKFTADKVEQSEDKILLKGNAKITSTQNDLIETDEIIVTFI